MKWLSEWHPLGRIRCVCGVGFIVCVWVGCLCYTPIAADSSPFCVNIQPEEEEVELSDVTNGELHHINSYMPQHILSECLVECNMESLYCICNCMHIYHSGQRNRVYHMQPSRPSVPSPPKIYFLSPIFFVILNSSLCIGPLSPLQNWSWSCWGKMSRAAKLKMTCTQYSSFLLFPTAVVLFTNCLTWPWMLH